MCLKLRFSASVTIVLALKTNLQWSCWNMAQGLHVIFILNFKNMRARTHTHTHRDTHTHRHTHIPGIYSRISKPTQIQWSRGSERDSQRSAFTRKTPLLILNNLNSSATWQLISLNYKLRRLFRKGISQRLGLCHSAELYPRSPQQHCHILGTQYMCLLDEWVNGRMKEGIPRQPGNLMF